MGDRAFVTMVAVVVLASLFLNSGPTGFAQEEQGRQIIKAIYIPLADHYAALVAYEKYRDHMKHADFQLERINGPILVRARFRDDDVDMAFNVCPMVMDMFHENPDFQWIGLMHRDGNALAINDRLNEYARLEMNRIDRKPDKRVAEAFTAVKEKMGKPCKCGIPSFLATHTVVLYKYLKDHGKTLALGRGNEKDVRAFTVAPPNAPAFLKKNNARRIPVSFEQSLPWAEVAETRGAGHVAWYSKDVMKWPRGHVECIIIAKKDVIRNKREAVREVVYYIHKAGMDIENARNNGPGTRAALTEIAEIVQKHIPEHTTEAIIQSLRQDINAINYKNLNVDKAGLKQIMDLAVEAGFLKQPIDIDKLANEEFSTTITEK